MPMNPRVRVVLLASLLLVSLGCGHSENRYLDRAVEPGELPGEWRVTAYSLRSLTAHQVEGGGAALAGNVMFLRPDGSCHFAGVPAPFGHHRTESECRWAISGEYRQKLILSEGTIDQTFFFTEDEESGRLLLWQFADDPDLWKYVEYQKQ